MNLDLVLPVPFLLPAPRLAPARRRDSPPNLHRNDRRPCSLLSLPHWSRSQPSLAYPCERLSIGERIRSLEYAVAVGRADGKWMQTVIAGLLERLWVVLTDLREDERKRERQHIPSLWAGAKVRTFALIVTWQGCT